MVTVLIGLGGACLGCGSDWQAATYPAAGRVTINGEAPVGAVVELRPTGPQADERNSRPWGIVTDDGAYSLTTYETGDGAPAGEYVFTIKWPPDVSKPSFADRLDGAYADPLKSPWKMTVSAGNNTLSPVNITGATVTPRDAALAPGNGPPGPGMGK